MEEKQFVGILVSFDSRSVNARHRLLKAVKYMKRFVNTNGDVTGGDQLSCSALRLWRRQLADSLLPNFHQHTLVYWLSRISLLCPSHGKKLYSNFIFPSEKQNTSALS